MRLVHRLAALILFAQLGLGGAGACESTDQRSAPLGSVQLAAEHHSTHVAGDDHEAQHPANHSCEREPMPQGCATMTTCSIAIVSLREEVLDDSVVAHRVIRGQLLPRAERSEEPELPPPRI
jgi:hypothetical protein